MTTKKFWYYAFALVGATFMLFSSCEKDDDDQQSIPILSTTEITEITQTTATSGGNITDEGGATVTARGVCWSTSQNPTISDSKTEDGTGTGNFTSSISGLEPNTTYYVRAYATNSEGTGYGSELSFTTLEDQDIPIPSTARFGVNLACGEFGTTPGVYNTNYTYPRVAELDYYKSKGLTLIRMPFKWERVQHDVAGSLDTDLDLMKIKEFVQAAEDRGISVILDMHNYARRKVYDKSFVIGQTDTLTIENFVDVWIKLANEFKGYSNIYGYDIMNEPHGLGTVSWFKVSQAVIDGIRSVDDHTPIIIEGNSFASSARWPKSSDSLKYLTDPANNIVYEAHCYFDSDASGLYESSYDNEVVSDMIYYTRLEPFVEWLKTNNKKGMIGEFGVPGNDTRWLTILDNSLTYMRDNNISATYWAGGPWWGTYTLSIEPSGTVGSYVDKPQMSILSKYGTNDTTAVQSKK